MNEPETPTTQPAPPEPQGIPIAKLLEVIGKQQVEWIVEEEAVGKLKAQAVAIFKQNQVLTAEVAALKAQTGVPVKPDIPADLEKLQAVNNSKDEEIHLLERQVHDTAIERDAARKQVQDIETQLREVNTRCDDLQKMVNISALTVTNTPVVITKGKKR
jgi:hypothetical protein